MSTTMLVFLALYLLMTLLVFGLLVALYVRHVRQTLVRLQGLVAAAQGELATAAASEAQRVAARQTANVAVREYNRLLATFPARLVGRAGGFTPLAELPGACPDRQ